MAEKIRERHLHGINDESIELIKYEHLGKAWVANFIERHPQIETVVGHTIEKSRIEGTTPEVLRQWFCSIQVRSHR